MKTKHNDTELKMYQIPAKLVLFGEDGLDTRKFELFIDSIHWSNIKMESVDLVSDGNLNQFFTIETTEKRFKDFMECVQGHSFITMFDESVVEEI